MRVEHIAARLTRSFRGDFGCAVALVPEKTWSDMPIEPRFRFGYMPPLPIVALSGESLVCVCPELIDRVTASLDDDMLDVYLTAVEAFVGAHLMNAGETSDQVMARVETELYEQAPEALALMSAVEATAIDDGIVACLS